MGDYDDADEAVGSTRPVHRRWPLLLAVVAALAVGVGLGYLWGAASEPAPPPAAAPPVTAPPPPPSPPPPELSSCTAVAQRGSDVIAQLDDAARAVGALDPAALRRVLDEIRRLRDELQRDVDACRTQAGAATGNP